jgi:hypothetical protein
MESDTLACCLKIILQNTKVKNSYVVARNELSLVDLKRLPVFVISNTQDIDKRGEHWISIFFYKKHGVVVAETFDSYGNNVEEKYHLKLPCKIVNKSSKVLQNCNSALCGVWCLMYIYYRSRQRSLAAFESRFSYNLERNDNIVRQFYNRFKVLKRYKRYPLLSCCTRNVNKL